MPSWRKKTAAIAEIARPKQWVKNAFVFAPLIFAREFGHAGSVVKAFLAFALFCLYSSCVYMINDIADLDRDRLHPDKRQRPLPSGRLDVATALAVCVILFLAASGASAWLSLSFLLVGWLYVATNILYSLWWKTVVILDGMIIALGFVLRTYAGAVVIGVSFSDWLYICAIFVSLFLAFCKRRHEILLLGEENAGNHRAILQEYSTAFLDQIICIVTAGAAVTYSLYCIDPNPEHGSAGYHPGMKYSIPFVLYGLFRYLFLAYRKEEGGNPTELLLSDRPLLVNGFLWTIVVFWVVYLGE